MIRATTSNPSKHVRVLIRTRPTCDFAEENIKLLSDIKSINVHLKRREENSVINNQQDQWNFVLDKVMHNQAQEAMYEECSPIVAGLLGGYNGTILAYGQTGSGKTFTMTGATENYKHRGIIPRAINHIFQMVSERPEIAYSIRVSYMEIYNENMVDLLSSLNDQKDEEEASLIVVEDKATNSTMVKGLTVKLAQTEEDALNYLFEGETNRSIAEHELNKRSSRSHCIFTIYVESRSRVESSEKVIYSKLNLVDLAGSERVSKTKSERDVLKEAMYINKSLTFLEQVILALGDKKRDHIPYRQSKLTNVLRDSLGGNCQTLMIGNIRCEKSHLEETISTLRFAMRMMCVSTNPVANVQDDPSSIIKKYERIIKELRQELAMHDTLANRSHIQYEPFTDFQRAELQKSLKLFLENQEEDIEIVSVRQIKEIFLLFKQLYRSLEVEVEERSKQRAIEKEERNEVLFSANNKDANSNSMDNNEKDDYAVGELEGMGFGVGIAPSGAKPSSANSPAKGKVKKLKKANAVTEIEDENVVETPPPASPVAPQPVEIAATTVAPSVQKQQSAIGVLNTTTVNVPTNLLPTKTAEFEKFKKNQGAELYKTLNTNKQALKDKKNQVKLFAEKVNDCKIKIDQLKNEIRKKDGDQLIDSTVHDLQKEGSKVIDQEQYTLLLSLKETKENYKKAFDGWKNSRNDIQYCEKLVAHCRERFLAEFEHWFNETYVKDGADDTQEDFMDVGEKFEKLHLEKVTQEDPSSVPFYNALRQQERKAVRGVRKTQMKTGKASAIIASTNNLHTEEII